MGQRRMQISASIGSIFSANQQYALLSIPLSGFGASVDASVNHEARDKRHHYADPKIYSFESSVELEDVCDYPEDRSGESYVISVHGWETEERKFEARLSDRPAVPHSRAQLTAPDSCHAVNRVS